MGGRSIRLQFHERCDGLTLIALEELAEFQQHHAGLNRVRMLAAQ
jgi:hypothetical protein